MRPARVLLAAFALTATVDLIALAAGSDTGHALAKPLLMPLLAAHAHSRGAPRLLTAALLLGWAGDVLLLSDADPAFLAGMASFAACHVCYLALFRRYGNEDRAPNSTPARVPHASDSRRPTPWPWPAPSRPSGPVSPPNSASPSPVTASC